MNLWEHTRYQGPEEEAEDNNLEEIFLGETEKKVNEGKKLYEFFWASPHFPSSS